ncbi:hypothetical protein [Dactylosporangium sp. NPDC048998]|uniref:hypothetical protein n=1 Tax=Dactylosporangium sp. NPDC048998 TaxID=3363976 RepID=UPI00371BA0DA
MAAVAVTVLTGGCGSSGTTGDACADYWNTMTRYSTDAPEYKAMKVEEAKGSSKLEDARAAWFKAQGNAVRPIADEAKTPELKQALTNITDSYSRGHGDAQALAEVEMLCPQQP